MRRATTVAIEPREELMTTKRYAVFVGDEEQPHIKVMRGPGYWSILFGKSRRIEVGNKVAVLEALRNWCLA